jgi:hypothetical protein
LTLRIAPEVYHLDFPQYATKSSIGRLNLVIGEVASHVGWDLFAKK